MPGNFSKNAQTNNLFVFLRWMIVSGLILVLPIYLLNCWPLTLYSPIVVQVIGWAGLISLLGILVYRWWQRRNNLQTASKKRLTGLAIIAGLAFLIYGIWGWAESDVSEVEIATAHATGHN